MRAAPIFPFAMNSPPRLAITAICAASSGGGEDVDGGSEDAGAFTGTVGCGAGGVEAGDAGGAGARVGARAGARVGARLVTICLSGRSPSRYAAWGLASGAAVSRAVTSTGLLPPRSSFGARLHRYPSTPAAAPIAVATITAVTSSCVEAEPSGARD